MGTGKTCFLVFCFVCWWGSISCQSVLENYPTLPRTTELRQKVIKLAESQLYVRELSGKNDGKEVEMYLRSIDRRKGDAWCAAFISWLHIENNIPNPESGWSPDWFRANLVFHKNNKRMNPFISRPGQVIGIWIPAKGRIGHVGMIISENRLHYNTIEGNTNSFGSDEGDGVYRKIRKKEGIYAISDFVGGEEILKALKKK
jgi:hypothetical protein